MTSDGHGIGRGTARALLVAAWALAAACGGDGESGTADPSADAATAGGPDTLPAAVRAPEVQEGYLTVSPEQVLEWQAEGEEFVLVDARDPIQFAQEHIPGAINIPYVDIRAGGRLPPRDARIVIYCSDPSCPISRYAYEALESIGYSNLYDMHAGIQGWKAEGYPTVIGEPRS